MRSALVSVKRSIARLTSLPTFNPSFYLWKEPCLHHIGSHQYLGEPSRRHEPASPAKRYRSEPIPARKDEPDFLENLDEEPDQDIALYPARGK